MIFKIIKMKKKKSLKIMRKKKVKTVFKRKIFIKDEIVFHLKFFLIIDF